MGKGYKVFLGLNGEDVSRIIKADPDLAVIDFNEFSDKAIKKLREKGIKLIAYLNVGSIEKTRSYYGKYKKFAIGNYADWDEKWMNISKEEWKDFVVRRAKKFKERGAMGLYIDNLDVVEEYRSLNLYYHAKVILKRICDETGLYVMINGADFFVRESIKEYRTYFDAIQQEEVFTLIKDIDKNKCGSQKAKERERLKKYCADVKKHGIDVYLLEYRPSAINKQRIAKFCKKYKMAHYNSATVDLI